MGSLKILASGHSPQAQAEARGKLFEKLMSEVLRHYGYNIDRIPRVNYAGMEIDIEGRTITMDIPLYAECKCYETDVNSPELQKFYGKYMTQWFKDERCHGLFIAMPGVNTHAKGFYREYIEGNKKVTVRLYEEDKVLEAVLGTHAVCSPDAIARLISDEVGKPGDWLLLYTDTGLFWVQYVIPQGAGIPSQVAFFDAKGNPISEQSTVDYLSELYPGLDDFEKINVQHPLPLQQMASQDVEQVVEVRGSAECFEYQFPASAEHFVGRQSVLEELDSFVKKIINKETSCRGILFQANSGWGKSSVVLACVDRLKKMGHFALAIDSRSASSTQFILRVIDYVLKHFDDLDGLLSDEKRPKAITGFEGTIKTLVTVGQVLQDNRKVMFIFLDQFENVFSLPETFRPIRDLLLKICDAQINVVLGFSWKTDLVGLTSEFPYKERDSVITSSKQVVLDRFSEVETTALLEKLRQELGSPLRKDLKFFLSEFSQGYPWLLKKLCAHVKSQRDSGVQQSAIANSLLKIEELFQEDLQGLSPDEKIALHRIAKVAPISISELGEELVPKVVQSLVDRRLLVTIGIKLDVYWDIFRDYLNSSSVPIQENYILRTSVSSVLRATKSLADSNGTLRMSEFQTLCGLSSKQSSYNVARDMRLLGLAETADGKVIPQVSFSGKGKDFEESLRTHLRERLPRNRLVWRLMDTLETKNSITLVEVANLLAKWCPYISATKQTWDSYARIFANWMDAADLAIYYRRESTLNHYTPGSEVREPHLRFGKRRGGVRVPYIQCMPVTKVARKLFHAAQTGGRVDWADSAKSTVAKSLATLEDLGFITRKGNTITLRPELAMFVLSPEEKAVSLFADRAMTIESFATFINILNAHKDEGVTTSQLGSELIKQLGADWQQSTAETTAKILLDWARHTKLAPGVFAKTAKGPRRGWKKKTDIQPGLFSDTDKE